MSQYWDEKKTTWHIQGTALFYYTRFFSAQCYIYLLLSKLNRDIPMPQWCYNEHKCIVTSDNPHGFLTYSRLFSTAQSGHQCDWVDRGWQLKTHYHIQFLLAKFDLPTHPAVTPWPLLAQRSNYICSSDPDKLLASMACPPCMSALHISGPVVVYCWASSRLTRDCLWRYHAVALLFWPLRWRAEIVPLWPALSPLVGIRLRSAR